MRKRGQTGGYFEVVPPKKGPNKGAGAKKSIFPNSLVDRNGYAVHELDLQGGDVGLLPVHGLLGHVSEGSGRNQLKIVRETAAWFLTRRPSPGPLGRRTPSRPAPGRCHAFLATSICLSVPIKLCVFSPSSYYSYTSPRFYIYDGRS